MVDSLEGCLGFSSFSSFTILFRVVIAVVALTNGIPEKFHQYVSNENVEENLLEDGSVFGSVSTVSTGFFSDGFPANFIIKES